MANKKLNEVIDKIKKLFALAESPNENEAAEATRKAQELMMRYNLSAEDIADSDNIFAKEDVFIFRKLAKWQEMLLTAIAKYNFVVSICKGIKGGDKTACFIGRPVNALSAKLQFEYLYQAIEKLTKEFLGNGVSAKQSFRIGAVLNLQFRMDRNLKEQKEQGIKSDIPNDSVSAIVVRDMHQTLEKELEILKESLSMTIKKSSNPSVDSHALNAGFKAGNSISLDKQIAS